MIDYQTAIFSAKDSVDYSVAGVFRCNLVYQILLVVQSHRAVFHCDEHIVFGGSFAVLHLLQGTDLSRHGNGPAFLSFEVETLQ